MPAPQYQLNDAMGGGGGGNTTPPWMQDISAGLNLAGNLYGLYEGAHLQGAAQDVFRQSDPFGGYRAGYGADLLKLMQNPSSVTKLPGYQFLMDQGTEAIARTAAAPGGKGYGSGGMDADLIKYGQGLADSFYQQQVGTLSHLAGADISPANPFQALQGMAGASNILGSSVGGIAGGLPGSISLLSRLASGFGGGGSSDATPYWAGAPGIDTDLNLGYQDLAFQQDPNLNNIPSLFGAGGSGGDLVAGGGGGATSYPDGAVSVPDLTGMFSFKAAGGEAAAMGGGLAGIGLNLASGKPGAAALSAASFLSRYPGMDPQIAKNLSAVGAAGGDILGIIQGVKAGGVSGYGQAGIDAARLGVMGGKAAGLLSSGTASEVGSALGYAAIPLSVYNFAKNWQSGNTGADALSGAATGASIGSVIPGVGTVIGAGVGAAVGALSSAFGPGKMDPENVGWNNYAAAYHKNPSLVAGASPAQNFQALTGIFDSRGSSIPFYQRYGRMGETQFTVGMAETINNAIKGGKIAPDANPAQIYTQVVQPWITSMGGAAGWRDANTSEGAPTKGAVGGLLTNLIAQWQAGMLNSQTPVGISGQNIAGLPQYGG